MRGNKKRRDFNRENDNKPKRKRVNERGRSTVKSRLRNLEDNWEMISERFIKGNKNESRNDGT